MKLLTTKELSKLALEFLEQAAPQMACVITTNNGDSDQIVNGELIPTYLSVKDTLAMWAQLPYCAYTHIFMGWLIAKGYNNAQHNPSLVEKAVYLALTGNEDNIINFSDYVGDGHGSQKLN